MTDDEQSHDRQCAYWAVPNGQRCEYPGSMSRGTNGGGPWYCRHHIGCSDAKEGAEIVQRSLSFRPAFPGDVEADHQAAAVAYCAECGLHTAEQMRDFCLRGIRGMVERSREIARKPVAVETADDAWGEGRE